MLTKKLKNQKGFTLIEIIAVLVILGILAAVAIPKFLDLQTEAKKKAMEGALAEGMSTMSINYGKLLLSEGKDVTTTAVATRAANNKPQSDEFEYTFALDNTGKVTVTGKTGTKFEGATAVSKLWKKS